MASKLSKPRLSVAAIQISLYALNAEEVIGSMFQMALKDVKRITAKRQGNKKG